ncbi:hypothetical protein Gogos_021638, partial [Gossypium gossypioides]|nr:hypothetical protein [Gossypium gossypioides]
ADERITPLVGADGEGDFEISENDIECSLVNGIPSIKFFGRVNQILIKDVTYTVVIKLLGRRIGYSTLHNKVCSLWKPSQPFHLIDVENGYFLAKFKNSEDFEKFPGLPRHMYKRQILREIGGLIGKVEKLSFNTDNGVRGRFARMAVYVNLDKALISQKSILKKQWNRKDWMKVTRKEVERRGRRMVKVGRKNSGEGSKEGTSSSHFQVLGTLVAKDSS